MVKHNYKANILTQKKLVGKSVHTCQSFTLAGKKKDNTPENSPSEHMPSNQQDGISGVLEASIQSSQYIFLYFCVGLAVTIAAIVLRCVCQDMFR